MGRLTISIIAIAIAASAADPHLVYPLPPEPAIAVNTGILYHTAADQKLYLDLYRLAKDAAARLPVVVFMNGIGSLDLKKSIQYQDWGRLVTGAGLAGVTFDTHGTAAIEDANALFTYLRTHADELKIDADNVILWACSANVSTG